MTVQVKPSAKQKELFPEADTEGNKTVADSSSEKLYAEEAVAEAAYQAALDLVKRHTLARK